MSDETERLLAEILQYVRATAVSSVRPQARSVIDSDRKAKVYAAMTGDRSQAEIAAATGVPQPTISRYQRDFFVAGLATPADNSHRNPRALFTLDELSLSDLLEVQTEAEEAPKPNSAKGA